jgi:hypothetical protein
MNLGEFDVTEFACPNSEFQRGDDKRPIPNMREVLHNVTEFVKWNRTGFLRIRPRQVYLVFRRLERIKIGRMRERGFVLKILIHTAEDRQFLVYDSRRVPLLISVIEGEPFDVFRRRTRRVTTRRFHELPLLSDYTSEVVDVALSVVTRLYFLLYIEVEWFERDALFEFFIEFG